MTTLPKPTVELYVDGACSGNPGPGGWGALLRYNQHEKELSGYEAHTTNNRMELTAAIQGLLAIKTASSVAITTDSQYVRQGITTWIHNWQKNNWLTSDKKPVKNADLWQQLLAATKPHTISWHWVRGHNGHVENERVDQLARTAIANRRIADG